ncbi:carboxymuconolactone decarboxylase family protein [Streptomyces sp. NPDC051173]|uniref:carboxymuconolactone decarboxylase family protein n=1 Tax=Streptomyces sp. NPDC051173 TaxID=3155164 RepID=UPI00344C08CE
MPATSAETPDPYATGSRIRREVLGDEHVNSALSNWPPAKPLFDLITAHNWGSVWAREGLDRRTRTLLNLALLTTLNRPEELRLYVRGALRNGCSVEDMAEVAVHCAAYAGGPAGIGLMRAVHEAHEAVSAEETVSAEG